MLIFHKICMYNTCMHSSEISELHCNQLRLATLQEDFIWSLFEVISSFCFFLQARKPGILHINNSRHLARKYARIFVRGHYLFPESCSEKAVNGQISEHIFAPNGGCLCFPSNLSRNASSFENWRIYSDVTQFYLGEYLVT